jgi:hypothetical protein
MSRPWIQTGNGAQFYLLDPKPKSIHLGDIAHALSLLCRYTGHVRCHYSVAQHSVLVSRLVPPQHALWGLMHDASEAYINDISSPLKHCPEMDFYRRVERVIMGAVCRRFGLPLEQPAEVRDADLRLLVTEKRDLLGPSPEPWPVEATHEPLVEHIIQWEARAAEEAFHARFRELCG